MALSVNFPDKILAGLNQSYTITSDEGTPRLTVELDSAALPHRLIRLGPPKDEDSHTSTLKFKVTFFLPEDSTGKKLKVALEAGTSRVEETRDVAES